MTEEKVGLVVHVPEKLKRALAREAKKTKTNVNEVAVGIIATAFDYKLTPPSVMLDMSKIKREKAGKPTVIYLRMPAELKTEVAMRAIRGRVNLSYLIREILAAGLNVKLNGGAAISRVPVGGQPR